MLHRGAWHKLESVGVVLVSTKKGHPYILQLLPGECRAGGKVRAGSQVDVPPCAGRLLQDWHLEVCAVAT